MPKKNVHKHLCTLKWEGNLAAGVVPIFEGVVLQKKMCTIKWGDMLQDTFWLPWLHPTPVLMTE